MDNELREKAAELYLRLEKARAAFRSVEYQEDPPELREAIAALDRDYQIKISALQKERRERSIELRKTHSAGANLELAVEEAEAAFEALATGEPLTEWDEDTDEHSIIRCKITGVPIFEDDEYVSDEETGEHWLRSALGLPPRPEVMEDKDADEEVAA